MYPQGKREEGEQLCRKYPAQKVETAVWELVSGLLKDPARLRAGLTKAIEGERRAVRDDPEREARA